MHPQVCKTDATVGRCAYLRKKVGLAADPRADLLTQTITIKRLFYFYSCKVRKNVQLEQSPLFGILGRADEKFWSFPPLALSLQ